MSRLKVLIIFLTTWFVDLDCEVYQDRPKITTSNGDLVLEPAFDKSVYFKTNGPKSTVYVGDVNLLNFTSSVGGGYSSEENFDKYLNGPNGILSRLQKLESRNQELPNDLLLNITILWRKINRQNVIISNIRRELLNPRGRDECQLQTCRNGGTCLNLVNGYHCLCPSNWEGQNCDVDVNECRNFAGTDLGCQNGATCINRPGSYECLCRSGWYGMHCTRRAKDCSGGDREMCDHGTCVQVTSGEGIKCICDQGWTTNGTDVVCNTDINECDSSQGPRCSVNPPVKCVNLPGSFRCGQCPPGFEGDGYICSDIDECLTIPNGGCSMNPMVECHNTIGSRICGPCPPGYQGDGLTCQWRGSCNINRGGCHPSAECVDNSAIGGPVQCVCPVGMEGDGIGLRGCYVVTDTNATQSCTGNPCGIHGQCHQLRSGYTCICYRGYSGAHCELTANYCASRPCYNGGTCVPDGSSRGFRCECTTQFTGDLCNVATKTCGGWLHAEEGSIVYPLSNTTYNHNSKCVWVIQTDSNKVINVTFSKFNLEYGPDCLYDFLQIHDGRNSASQMIGRFCGTDYPKSGIISSHNTLYLWFRSDDTVAKEGFALHWTSIDPVCGGEIDATLHGHISSPGSPGNYPPNRDCYWHLTTTLGKRIQLHFFVLDIESHKNCSYDYVAIYDGAQNTDPLLSKYCNSTQPPPIESGGSEILIHFHSDAYGSGKGFQIAFAPSIGIPGCGGLYTDEKGEIVSPTINGKYMPNLNCEYKIRAEPNSKIRIHFQSFKLERNTGCKYDYVKIYDGPSSDSRLYGRFCGLSHPKSFTSSSNTLYIKFVSDSSLVAEGFRIIYETICQQTVTGDSGVIKSPNYPFTYPSNKVCEYIISTSPGKVIKLSFQDFDIEDSRDRSCQSDNVEIRDGMDANATLIGRYCGGAQYTPSVPPSTHNYLYLKFTSDLSISGTGFYANYTTVDVVCGGIYTETTGLINHPKDGESVYGHEQTCVWFLIAPVGYHIKLTWNRFDIERLQGCSADFLELSEIDSTDEENNLGKYCGKELPPTMITSTNQLKIKFQSDSSLTFTGFSMSYSFLNEKSFCGGRYSKSHGNIYSPGWPKNYDNGRDCVWVITAPAGRQIRLNFIQFELERLFRSKCNHADYLEVRSGRSEISPLIGKYCGNVKPKRIVSLENSLYIHFHSDISLTAKGFNLEWDNTVTGCGGTLTTASGSISSPNYPEPYSANAECFYKIVTSAGSRIQIKFTEIDLERTVNCKDDYVEIYDGRDSNAPSLGKHCYMLPKLNSFMTTSNYAYVKFRSDFYIGGKGFLFEYDTICSNNVTGMYGVIETPGYPDEYPPNLNCLWTINVPKGNKINITFTYVDIFNPYFSSFWSRNTTLGKVQCHFDYLQMKETTERHFNEKICGKPPPFRISSKTNSFQINFVSRPPDIPHTGFRLEWVRYGCGGHLQKRFGTIKLDKSFISSGEMECEWLIEAPPGTSISISINSLHVEESLNCTTDAIEIYNGQNVNTPLITKICHERSARVQTTTNFMLVRFVKKSSTKDVYFNSVFDSYHTGCGSTIEAQTGIIQSKNYPQNYDNNLDCMWKLIVPFNHRVQLNFIELDLYKTDDDSETECGDSIKIYGGKYFLDSNYSQVICPGSKIAQITSKDNMLGLQFITNGQDASKGFKANFTAICGSTIIAVYDGILKSDKSISSTTHNCTWTVRASTPDKKISLTITHLSIPRDSDIITDRHCPSSYLRVYDGEDDQAPLVDEFCGRKVPPMIVSHGSAITVQLGSYSGSINGHFSAHYSPLVSACGGDLTSEEGSIASPNYPGSYPVNANCEWTLSTSPGNRVYVTFERFDLENSENCNVDYLELRQNDGAGPLLGVYCGTDTPTNTTVASKLYIKFHSDNKNSGTGFLIHYGFLHGNYITGQKSGIVTSPLYPFKYEGSGDFTWRIEIDSGTITMSVNKLEIPTHGAICYNSLSVYDGYDKEAPIIGEFCGLVNNGEVMVSSSNLVFINLRLTESNPGSIFHITWAKSDESVKSSESTINCGNNNTEMVGAGQAINFNSPNYPQDYSDYLKCEWVYKSDLGHHLILNFEEIRLEPSQHCLADYISIYSSDDAVSWKPVKENICSAADVTQELNATNYMKITFNSDVAVTAKGFQGKVISACGGLIHNSSGVVEPLWLDVRNKRMGRNIKTKCEWTVKVRPGRTISASFENFNITNQKDDCSTFVILRNGDSVEAPLLNTGKYCGYDNEDRGTMETFSNAIFISYEFNLFRNLHTFQSFRLRYEEKSFECGLKSTLDEDHKWEIINSPNYPSVPAPYSECEWIFTGPPGEILRIDFIDRFDIKRSENCIDEVLEIRDGVSEISPLKGRFCGDNPGTIKTDGNIVFIKYLTQLADPKNGFKANVSIDVCGGTIVSNKGEIASPGYPHMQVFSPGSVCEWRIIGSSRLAFNINPQDVDLPESEAECATKITFEEFIPVNKTVVVLHTICGEDIDDTSSSTIQSSSNEVIIKLYIGTPAEWTQMSERRGFRLTFNSSRSTCGGLITTPEGYITTPGYPRYTTLRYCQWLINVPNENRRVRLEILDSDVTIQRIGMYNDLNSQSSIQILPSSDLSYSSSRIFESTGNKLAIYVWLNVLSTHHRFKAKFSSEEESLCGGNLSGIEGELIAPDIERSYSCEWHYKPPLTQVNGDRKFNTFYVSAKLNSSTSRTICRYSDPKLMLKSVSSMTIPIFNRNLCGNLETSLRIPSDTLDLKAIKSNTNSFYFNLKWKLHPCGGLVEIGENPVNILNVPSYNKTLECVWYIHFPINGRIEITLDGTFQLECENEFVQIKQGLDPYSKIIGDYCIDRKQEKPLVLAYRNIFVEYHSKPKNNTTVKLLTKTATSRCGGYLSSYDRMFSSPSYPLSYEPNMECTWEITADLGNRISLQFIDRFAIEDVVNCTKDAVIVYDWKDDTYTQIARVCGRQTPSPFNSTYNKMKVVLRTDQNINLEGFRAIWTPICGGNFTATEKEQFVFSPGYPVEYSPSLDCSYKITSDTRITLKFLDFELEGTYPGCEFDNVSLEAYSDNDFLDVVYCGSKIPTPLHSFTDIKLNFKTDRYIQRRGFKLSYSKYSCGGEVKQPSVLSSGPDETYDINLNCTWLIEAPKNKIVVLKFQYIFTENSDDCQADYISVYDGLQIDTDRRLALICGSVNSSTVIRSTGNKMALQFISDYALGYKGFKVEVSFSYSEAVGCGGYINLISSSSYILDSPLIGGSPVYENFLDCHWNINSPPDTRIQVEFLSFHIAPCSGVNQTALGYSKCDCDLVEIKDGLNPNSLLIGQYCGHSTPPKLYSSGNLLSIRLATDGDNPSKGFKARLTVLPSVCGHTWITVSNKVQRISSPGYSTGSVPRGVHCAYHLDASSKQYETLRLTIKNLDLMPGDPEPSQCNRDRLSISSYSYAGNSSLGKDYILKLTQDGFFEPYNVNDFVFETPNNFMLCGKKQSVDFYLTGDVSINLQTFSDSDIKYNGFEMDVVFIDFCGRNYTELQGRIKSDYFAADHENDCYTLITAPENYTISVYFIIVMTTYYDTSAYLEILDGDKANSKRLIKINEDYETNAPVFSTGRHLLLHHHYNEAGDVVKYDLNYMSTDKGRGCGGKLHNLLGRVTSPLYPAVYRNKGTCEWELETPAGTRLRLHFAQFDLGRACDANFVQLVDRSGAALTYCAETPADYVANDNYVKIVFTTNMNNGGSGWIADFVAVV